LEALLAYSVDPDIFSAREPVSQNLQITQIDQ
jgi:hypothetical protein